MQIVTVQFNYDHGPDYKLLLDVFRHSCKKYMPDAEFIEYIINPPKKQFGIAYNFTYNTEKLKIWAKHMRETTDNVIFADCDMLCNGDASSAFDYDFDIGYTERTKTMRIPMNGGIVFAKPTDAAREFFDGWEKINNRMVENDLKGDSSLHNKYRVKWAGMNQAAFGWMMAHMKEFSAKLKVFQTIKWNAVDCDWTDLKDGNDTVFIHYKSSLRKLVLENTRPKPGMEYCKKVWYDMLKEMGIEYKEPEKVYIQPPQPLKKYKVRKV